MGDLPSSNLEEDKAIQELLAEIDDLRGKHARLRAEKRQWQQKRKLLFEQSAAKFGIDHPDENQSTKPTMVVQHGTLESEQLTLQDRIQAMIQSTHHRQDEALEDFRSAMARRKHLTETSNLARESKALHDAFHIGYQGPFATINGLRLGAEATLEDYQGDEGGTGTAILGNRGSNGSSNTVSAGSSTVKVPWSEINSALGSLALLLACLEQKPHAGIRYKHEIVCCGSTSKIGLGRRDENQRGVGTISSTYYNLFSDDSFQFFGRRNFNTALQCLVQCVTDAAEAIQRRDPTINLPHLIERSNRDVTIGGLPVAYGADAVEWTRAMKYLLTNVKYLTTYRAFGLWDVVMDN
eukprot:scaffold1055_cov165-Amphora_coffeaeformis.AAC.2